MMGIFGGKLMMRAGGRKLTLIGVPLLAVFFLLRGDAPVDRGGFVVSLPAGHAGMAAADVGGQERLGADASLLRGVL